MPQQFSVSRHFICPQDCFHHHYPCCNKYLLCTPFLLWWIPSGGMSRLKGMCIYIWNCGRYCKLASRVKDGCNVQECLFLHRLVSIMLLIIVMWLLRVFSALSLTSFSFQVIILDWVITRMGYINLNSIVTWHCVYICGWAVVAYNFNPRTQEAEVGESLSSRPACAAE